MYGVINFIERVIILWFLEFIKILSAIPFAILHVVSAHSFPKPLSAKEEKKIYELIEIRR